MGPEFNPPQTRGHVRNGLLAEVCLEFLLRRRTARPLLKEAGKVISGLFKVEGSLIRQQGQKVASMEHTDGVRLGWFHDVLRERKCEVRERQQQPKRNLDTDWTGFEQPLTVRL